MSSADAGQHLFNVSRTAVTMGQVSGAVTVEVDGVVCGYQAPAVITILAGQHHRIEAQEDAVWFCIHATDEKDVARLDDVLIRR